MTVTTTWARHHVWHCDGE